MNIDPKPLLFCDMLIHPIHQEMSGGGTSLYGHTHYWKYHSYSTKKKANQKHLLSLL